MFGTNERVGRYTKKDTLLVRSMFRTIQGEGPYAGSDAVFVRLGGCNLACTWCDTEFDVERSTEWRTGPLVEEVIRLAADGATRVFQSNAPVVVITGGEPFRFDLHAFCVELTKLGFRVQIETNGTLMPKRDNGQYFGLVAAVVVSPKTTTVHRHWTGHRGDRVFWKLIVGPDGPVGEKPNTVVPVAPPTMLHNGRAYVQPLDDGDDGAVSPAVSAQLQAMARTGYRVSLQTHKLLNVE